MTAPVRPEGATAGRRQCTLSAHHVARGCRYGSQLPAPCVRITHMHAHAGDTVHRTWRGPLRSAYRRVFFAGRSSRARLTASARWCTALSVASQSIHGMSPTLIPCTDPSRSCCGGGRGVVVVVWTDPRGAAGALLWWLCCCCGHLSAGEEVRRQRDSLESRRAPVADRVGKRFSELRLLTHSDADAAACGYRRALRRRANHTLRALTSSATPAAHHVDAVGITRRGDDARDAVRGHAYETPRLRRGRHVAHAFVDIFVGSARPDGRCAKPDGHREAGDELAERLRLRGDARPREEIREELPRGRFVSPQPVRQRGGACGLAMSPAV